MNKRALVWMLIALSLMAALSACILVPVGGDHHHGGDDYHRSGDYHEHD
ncbi:hypothetical protein SBC1_72040 (plasmid) [Caballeronia sp. SBC1]|nr:MULTISPECIES: hypothetical protein [unclassified Caballeronia]QIE29413.1 hypothetical protein SBC2_74890 [Caballeronia sp. SBC2]QIN67157.1 hypothetical protein SBC1_72040 [Caballeronia sp. SBC1]